MSSSERTTISSRPPSGAGSRAGECACSRVARFVSAAFPGVPNGASVPRCWGAGPPDGDTGVPGDVAGSRAQGGRIGRRADTIPGYRRRALPIRGPLPAAWAVGMLEVTKEWCDDGGPAMTLATWWTIDPLPLVRPLPGFHAEPATDDAALATLNGISLEEVRARRAAGHRPYVGLLDGV